MDLSCFLSSRASKRHEFMPPSFFVPNHAAIGPQDELVHDMRLVDLVDIKVPRIIIVVLDRGRDALMPKASYPC